jgi:hypothetical protein
VPSHIFFLYKKNQNKSTTKKKKKKNQKKKKKVDLGLLPLCSPSFSSPHLTFSTSHALVFDVTLISYVILVTQALHIPYLHHLHIINQDVIFLFLLSHLCIQCYSGFCSNSKTYANTQIFNPSLASIRLKGLKQSHWRLLTAEK